MSNARSPQLRFGRGGPVDDSTAALRIAFVVACFLNPITTLITLAVILCGRTPVARRVPTWILPLTGIAACAAGWTAGWCADYLRTYREAAAQFLDALITALRINGPPQAIRRHLARERRRRGAAGSHQTPRQRQARASSQGPPTRGHSRRVGRRNGE